MKPVNDKEFIKTLFDNFGTLIVILFYDSKK